MREPVAPLEYRRLRAPREQGSVFITPSLSEASEVLRDQSSSWEEKFGADRVAAIRAEVFDLAMKHTSQYRDCTWVAPRGSNPRAPWVVTGHQPVFYHPGVWIKNYALSVLGHNHEAVPLNLIVDNDLCTDSSLRIPLSQVDAPPGKRWTQWTALWDEPSSPVPFEDRYVADAERFQSFSKHTEAAARRLTDSPLIHELWPTATQLQSAGRPAGECFAIARHRFEASVGLRTLEAPLGKVFDLPMVREWTSDILDELPKLHSIYNATLSVFRTKHRIRSRSHPVPNLDMDGLWFESPFWVWSIRSPQRRPLWVRAGDSQVELSDGEERLVSAGNFCDAIAAIESSHRVRPRALMTTLFARTMLGQLFIHGIGGAKYDQLTDAIILNFFGVSPPPFLTLTATFRLSDPPIERLQQEARELSQLLRELRFNPQRHLSPTEGIAPWLAEKAKLLGEKHDLASRHHRLKAINTALQPWVEPIREKAQRQLDLAKASVRESQIAGSREYSIAWHHAEELPNQLLDLCQKAQ